MMKNDDKIDTQKMTLTLKEAERVSVQLRGHDFTGLGFNVAGNMRDGICIKDLLNRGPAFESGKIAPGKRKHRLSNTGLTQPSLSISLSLSISFLSLSQLACMILIYLITLLIEFHSLLQQKKKF